MLYFGFSLVLNVAEIRKMYSINTYSFKILIAIKKIETFIKEHFLNETEFQNIVEQGKKTINARTHATITLFIYSELIY